MRDHTSSQRRSMVDKSSTKLSVVNQCNLLSIHRSGLYYKPKQESPLNLELMRKIDEQYLKTPFYGHRRMAEWLKRQGYQVNRKRIRRLYKLMGLEAIYPKKNLSKPGKGHKIYPYLLRGLQIDRPSQVWASDITYLPMKSGFMYLMAIIDVHSRYVVHWSISNSMEAEWCCEVLEEALGLHGKPEIFNTDQGSQFTSDVFTGILKRNEIRISMDGKGRAIDNIFIERLWRSVKQEHVYLYPQDNGLSLYKGLKEYFDFYNNERQHQSLDYITPEEVFNTCEKNWAA